MIKCFLIPMTTPPYSQENPQRPKYVDKFVNNRTNSPLFKANYFVTKIAAKNKDLLWLQKQKGVIDFPNIDTDKFEDIPKERQEKNLKIARSIGVTNERNELNRDFINKCARVEGNITWDKDKVFVEDIDG